MSSDTDLDAAIFGEQSDDIARGTLSFHTSKQIHECINFDIFVSAFATVQMAIAHLLADKEGSPFARSGYALCMVFALLIVKLLILYYHRLERFSASMILVITMIWLTEASFFLSPQSFKISP